MGRVASVKPRWRREEVRCETVEARVLKVTGIGSERVKLGTVRCQPGIYQNSKKYRKELGSCVRVHVLLPHLLLLRAIIVLHHLPLLHNVRYIAIRARYFVAIPLGLFRSAHPRRQHTFAVPVPHPKRREL
jgi:hypothetical protein